MRTHVITGACSDFADKRDSQCLEQIVELTEENLKENGIELQELLADGGYSSGEALTYLHEKTSTPTSLTSDNTKSDEKVLVYHKEENYYQCTKPEGKSKLNCFSKAKKWIVKATPNERTEAVKQIVKTVHSRENLVVAKAPSSKS